MKRKILALLLACMMLLAVMPTAVFAVEDDFGHEGHDHACAGTTHTLENCPDAVLVKTVAPQYGEYGYDLYQCPDCHEFFAANFTKYEEDNCTHDWKIIAEAKAATCTKAGMEEVKKCKLCGKTEGGDPIPAGHKYVYQNGPCGEGICSVCGDKKAATDHTWSDPEIIKEPTWNESGLAKYTCTVEDCVATKEVEIVPEHDHKLTHHKAVEATCTEKGNIEYWECSICGKLFKDKDAKGEIKAEDIVIKAQHAYDEKPTKIPATCETYGFTFYACKVCGARDDARTETLKPLGHTTFDDKASKDTEEKDATCTVDGYQKWTCGNCGAKFEKTLEKTGHSAKTVTLPATCGKYELTFTYCENENCPLPSYEEVTDGKVSYDIRVDDKPVHLIQKKFGTKYDPEKHDIAWTVINEATCEKEGNKVGYCKHCNQYETAVIEKKGHDFDHTIEDNMTLKTAQTCTTDEVWIVECSHGCGKTEKWTNPDKLKLGHDWGDSKVIAPTCKVKGYTTQTCKTCRATRKINETTYAPKDIYTMSEAFATHNLSEEAKATVRPGTCNVVGLYSYLCADCGKQILVEDETTGKGHIMPDNLGEKPENAGKNDEFAGKEATCTEAGYTAQYRCTSCGEWVLSKPIKALGHKYVEVSAGVPATCTTEGKKAKYVCETCKAVDPKNDGSVIPVIEMVIKDQRSATCEKYGYVHYVCPDECGCGREYIDTYEKALGHKWTLNKKASVAPTCTEEGKDVSVCANGAKCDCENATKEEAVPATGHKNKAGKLIVDACTDTTEDRKCVNCKTEIAKTHKAVETGTTARVTCTEFGYTTKYCADCGWSDVTVIEPLGHLLSPWDLTINTPTFTTEGKIEKWCDRCSEWVEQILPVLEGDGICFSLEVDNANKSGAGFADSSLVKVTVSLDSAEEVGVWGINFKLNYNSSAVTFVKEEFVSKNFITNTLANDDGNGTVSVIASVPNSEDKVVQNAIVDGSEDFVVLYFRINNPNSRGTYFSINTADVLNADGETVKWYRGYSKIDIKKFLDVNGDKDVNLADALIVYNMIVGASEKDYDVTVDVDKNGVVNVDDFRYLYEYLVGIKTYENMVGLGVNEKPIEGDKE